ncbi:hypothetical protein BJ165DRAFT_1515164 [Panaeolus papilionaceus]|nr:hypothetical protein BJ165DRAFT_1515164 [Panaeolus papilionaceus]
MLKIVHRALIFLCVVLLFLSSVDAFRFKYSQKLQEDLDNSLHSVKMYLDKLEKDINNSIVDIHFLLDRGLAIPYNGKGKNYHKILHRALGPYIDDPNIQTALFRDLKGVMDVLEKGEVLITGIETEITVPNLFVIISPDHRSVKVTMELFTHKGRNDYVRRFAMMREIYRVLVPRTICSEQVAILPRPGSSNHRDARIRFLIEGGPGPERGELFGFTDVTENYEFISSTRRGAPFMFKIPDVFPVLAYCWDTNAVDLPSMNVVDAQRSSKKRGKHYRF